jgi:outer membrane protein assembly factor BamB
MAFDTQQPDTMLWQFQTAGSIYSRPAVDPAGGYLYFGSSDKHLYALTGEGIFLWRVPVEDNIAAEPLIAQESVVATAEDGSVYALDKITGALQWRVSLGGASVAAPAHFPTSQGDLIVVASDDGAVVALDSTTGTVAWQSNLDEAVRAPLQVHGDTLFVGTTSAIYAIASDGSVLWSAEILAALHSAPAFDGQNLYLVDTLGWLYAMDAASGRLLWRGNEPKYMGQPLLIPDASAPSAKSVQVLVASADGTLSAFSTNGELRQQWHLTGVEDGSDQRTPNFTLGPTIGGGALWIGDDHGMIYRLGPPITTP